jgi:hypothetical protein
MWQITWMLGLLPDWFWTLLLISSIIAIGLSKFIALYKLPLRWGGLAGLLLSIWCLGAASNEEKWQERVKELEAKLLAAENKSHEENVKIEEKVVTKTKVIKEKGEDIIKFIDREVLKNNEIIKYVENCPVPKDVIEIHNSAVRMNRTEGEKK